LKKILLYTGPVKSGKTTKLQLFIKDRKDVGGILSPVIGMKKYLCDISTGNKLLLEADLNDAKTDIVSVGKYKFKIEVFEWGKNILKKASTEKYNYIVIDEIGPLEFAGEGLSPAVDEILNDHLNYNYQLLVIVRD
jgi:nucleoside-triphosphatase THEP1